MREAAIKTEATRLAEATAPASALKPPPYWGYANDPVGFFRDVLGLEPWEGTDGAPGQADIVRALPGCKTIAVRSGHKVGKSTTAAGLAWWWFSTRENARVIITAPTHRQIKSVVWREVRRLRRKALKPLDGSVALDPSTGIQSEDGREIVGFSTNDPDKFSGFSSPNVLYIVDEASGVDDLIFDALEGNRAGGAWLVMLGNPTKTSGKFYRAFTIEAPYTRCIHISSANTPDGIPGLATKVWVDERAQVWGVDSSIYQVRVAGNFPAEGDNAIIPLYLVERAKEAHANEIGATPGRLRVGVDAARFGDDDFVIQGVIGNRTLAPRIPRKPSRSEMTVEQLNEWLAGQVVIYANEMAAKHKQTAKYGKPIINVDATGVGGAIWGILHRNKAFESYAVETGAKPTGTADDGAGAGKVENADRYYNLRAQLHFCLRDWLRDGGGIHEDALLEQELVAPTFTFDTQNRIKVERKEEIKSRIGRSPDRMDALQLAVYQAPPPQEFRTQAVPGFYL